MKDVNNSCQLIKYKLVNGKMPMKKLSVNRLLIAYVPLVTFIEIENVSCTTFEKGKTGVIQHRIDEDGS